MSKRFIFLIITVCVLSLSLDFSLFADTPQSESNDQVISFKGKVLKETDESLYVDVQNDVIRVPRESLTEDIPVVSKTNTPESNTTQISSGPISANTQTTIRKPARPFKEILPELTRGVVIVKNASGSGTGFLIDMEGNIITNHHVVKDEKYNSVTFFYQKGDSLVEKKIENAKLIALSKLMDIALLNVPAEEIVDLPVAPLQFAPENSIETGDKVFAIGNPGVGYNQILEQSVSEGIISATNRNFGDLLYLQTTAAVNPGNSGGPLVNERGEIVGLITFKYIMFYEGLSFALPVQYIRMFLDNQKAYAFGKKHPRTGFYYHEPIPWTDDSIQDEE